MSWTNEYGFIRDEHGEWMDALGFCCACERVDRVAYLDKVDRFWCSHCIENLLDIQP